MPNTPANRGDFAREAIEVHRELARLPDPIRATVRRLRRAYAQGQLLDLINGQIHELARADGALVSVQRAGGPDYRLLPEDRRQEYLERIVSRSGFLNTLRNEACRILRAENIQRRIYPEEGLRLDERVPVDGALAVSGTTRLNRAEAIFECMNVGVASAIANWVTEGSRAIISDELGFDDRDLVRVLSWHCGLAGVLAVVLDLLKPDGLQFAITEVEAFRDVRDRHGSSWWSGAHGVDPIDGEKSSPVVERRYSLPAEAQRFRFVILDMPPPGIGHGCSLRNTYKSQRERRLRDPGRFVPRRWRNELRRYVGYLPGLLEDEGEAVLLLPLGVRENHGYRREEHLLDGVDGWLDQAGLRVLRSVAVEERGPLAQPFVGTSRPERRLIIVTRRAP